MGFKERNPSYKIGILRSLARGWNIHIFLTGSTIVRASYNQQRDLKAELWMVSSKEKSVAL